MSSGCTRSRWAEVGSRADVSLPLITQTTVTLSAWLGLNGASAAAVSMCRRIGPGTHNRTCMQTDAAPGGPLRCACILSQGKCPPDIHSHKCPHGQRSRVMLSM